jgi:SSS family solute:Na+ symporter
MGWIAIGSSLFATNISSEHFIGLAGIGSIHGLKSGHFEWMAVILLILLGWFIAPVLIKSNVYTVPEFIGKRFGQKCRNYFTTVSVAAYIFLKIGVTLMAAGYILTKVLGMDMVTTSILIVFLTGFYTVIGGLSSVMHTHIFQAVMLLVGAFLLTFFGLEEVGGFSVLTSKLPADYFTIFKSISDPDFPWTGIILGAPILGIWYWYTDQYIIQRILSAKNVQEARKGTILTAFLKIFPIFLFILPGLIVAVLYPNSKGDEAFSTLLASSILPNGIRGIVIAGLFAAIMSSLASAFNSAATLIANDYFKPRKPDATDHELILVGRLATMAMIMIAIITVPMTRIVNANIYIVLQSLQAFISPPIASVFLFVFWKKATARGAFSSLIVGGVLGVLKILVTVFDSTIVSHSLIFELYKNINYLHFAVGLFIICTLVNVFVSLLQKENALSMSDIKYSFSGSNRLSIETESKNEKVIIDKQ